MQVVLESDGEEIKSFNVEGPSLERWSSTRHVMIGDRIFTYTNEGNWPDKSIKFVHFSETLTQTFDNLDDVL